MFLAFDMSGSLAGVSEGASFAGAVQPVKDRPE
jgi:hypothetical protein